MKLLTALVLLLAVTGSAYAGFLSEVYPNNQSQDNTSHQTNCYEVIVMGRPELHCDNR